MYYVPYIWDSTDIENNFLKSDVISLCYPDRIIRESKKVFEDVVEDFHSLDYIKSHFEVWRKEYANTYRDAYIGLCLPKLFNPLVRLQLITWNPLEVGHGCIISVTSFFLKGNWMRNGDGIFFFSIHCAGAVCKLWVHALVWVAAVLRLWREQHVAKRRWRHRLAACYSGEGHPLQTVRFEA